MWTVGVRPRAGHQPADRAAEDAAIAVAAYKADPGNSALAEGVQGHVAGVVGDQELPEVDEIETIKA